MLWENKKLRSTKEKSEVTVNVDGVSLIQSSERTWSDGPSEREPAAITSQWRIGWQTPTLMLTCYILSAMIAVAHYLFFLYLDGREASGTLAILPQAFVTTISNILANAFGFALRASLAVAFAQHLWYLLRVQTMKVSTIELLHTIRTNLFMLFMPVVIKATPILTMLASVMWASQVVTSFPPGSITVTSAVKEGYQLIDALNFDPSFMGNASAVDANRYALINLTPYMFGFSTGSSDAVKDGNILNRLGRQTLVSNLPLSAPSQCGANCSYTTSFEAPWFQCNTSRTEYIHGDGSAIFPIYAANWTAPLRASKTTTYNGTYTLAIFNSTTLIPIEANGTDVTGTRDTSVKLQQDQTTCIPGRAMYTVNHIWSNNILTRDATAKPLGPLRNLAIRTYEGIIGVGGFAVNPPANESGFRFGTERAEWSPEALELYTDNNMMAIFSALMSHIVGEYSGFLAPGGFAPAVQEGNFSSYELVWNDVVRTQNSGRTLSRGALNGNIIENTLFNNATGKYSAFSPIHPSFNVTQSLLNAYLFNMTISMMHAYGNWHTTTNATTSATINVYSFSEPLTLIIPYFATLLVSLPFLILGLIALRRNGVSAIDNSFIQILATSTGSAAVDRAAAGACLGGNENVPNELKDLKIRFGEIIDRNEPGGIKRAAFGVDGEVTELTRNTKYGIARWL